MIIVAEFDLRNADRVVLVNDRQNVPLEKGGDGVSSVEITAAVVEVASGEKNLGGVNLVPVQTFLIGPHEKALAYGGTALKLAQVRGPFGEFQAAHAGANGPRADQGDLAARLA